MTVLLILHACLIGQPTVCQSVPVDWETPITCAIYGQLQGTLWLRDHPKWRIAGWDCEPRRERRV